VAAAFTRRLIEVLPNQNQLDESEVEDTKPGDPPVMMTMTSLPPVQLVLSSSDGEQPNGVKGAAERNDELTWPSHDIVMSLHVHPKKRNSICIEVHFTKHFPGYQDTQAMSVEIPNRRSLITGCVERLLEQWRIYLGNKRGNEHALRKSGEELFRCILGPFDEEHQDNSERFDGFRNLCRDQSLRIRILTKDIFIPWDLLYIPGKGFVGQFHCVETGVARRYIGLRDENRRSDLFDFGKLPFVISHQVQSEAYTIHDELRSFLAKYRSKDLLCVERNDIAQFRDSIGRSARDQLIYFSFAHALERDPSYGRGVQFRVGTESFLAEDLRDWLSNTSLPYRPLLFLNLYGNPEKHHALRIIEQYHEFHSEFFAAGASAIVGPEVPIDFDRAATFASMFCEFLFKGAPDSSHTRLTVGDSLWATKKRLLEQGELYGLLYSYYLVRDIAFTHELTHVKPPLGTESKVTVLSDKGLQSHVG
jgi:hypothetical protein